LENNIIQVLRKENTMQRRWFNNCVWKRKRGRTKRRWEDCLKNNMAEIQLKENETQDHVNVLDKDLHWQPHLNGNKIRRFFYSRNTIITL